MVQRSAFQTALLLLFLPLSYGGAVKNVYSVSGPCNGTDWFSRAVKSGIRQLSNYHAKHICWDGRNSADGPIPYGFTNDFVVREGLNQVVAEVGSDGLKDTIVLVGCSWAFYTVPFDDCWNNVVELMKLGMGVVNIFGPGEALNFSQHGVNPEEVLYMAVPSQSLAMDKEGANMMGQELCRLNKGSSTLKYGKVYDENQGYNNYRIDLSLDAFEKECPEVNAQLVWEVQNWTYEVDSQDLRAKLLQDLPDVILTTSDDDAEKLVLTAKNILARDKYDRLTATGWNNFYPKLVEERKILVTMDNMLFQRAKAFIELVDRGVVRNTRDWQKEFGLKEDTFAVNLPFPTLISSDPEGYLMENLQKSYNSNTSPSPKVSVSTGLLNVSVTSFLPFKGHFDTKLTTRYSWLDPRLRWDPFVYNGTLQMQRDDIWTPELFFSNDHGSGIGTIFEPPATVFSNGTVVLETVLRAEFLCPTSDGMRWYPFDSYQCSMDLTRLHAWIHLDSSWGLGVDDCDSYFACSPGIQENSDLIHYQIHFERKQVTGWLRLVIPGVLINLVGFMTFWIPEQPESVALGITSLLCVVAFRSTVEMPSTADMTWSEWFLVLSVVYQFIVLVIIFCSYSRCLSSLLDKLLQAMCGWVQDSKHGELVEKKKHEEDSSGEPEDGTSGRVHSHSHSQGTLQHRLRTSLGNDSSSSHPIQVGVMEAAAPKEEQQVALVEDSNTTRNHAAPNADWVGRWFVVPTYFLLLAILLLSAAFQ